MAKIKDFEEAINELIDNKVLPSSFVLKSVRVDFSGEEAYVNLAYGTYGYKGDKIIKWNFMGQASESCGVNNETFVAVYDTDGKVLFENPIKFIPARAYDLFGKCKA